MRHNILAAVCLLTLAACDYRMEPKDVAEYSTRNLCNIYSAPMGMNRGSAVIVAELEKRGEANCVRPDVAANRRDNTVATAVFGPLGGLIHSVASPEPTEEKPKTAQTVDEEIAQVRREQAEQQRRERIASMAAQSASDEDIKKALNSMSLSSRDR